MALNVFYGKKEKIYTAYNSKHNSNCEKQVIFLIILNEEGRQGPKGTHLFNEQGTQLLLIYFTEVKL